MVKKMKCPDHDTKHKLLGTTIWVYMDNITITTHTTVHGHTTAVHDVLKLAAEHNLYFKPEKCIFHALQIDYLGIILERG